MASPCPPDKVQVCTAWHTGPSPPAAATPPTPPLRHPECQLLPRAGDSRKAYSCYIHTCLEAFPTSSSDSSSLRPPMKPRRSWSLTANLKYRPDHPEQPTVFLSIPLRTGVESYLAKAWHTVGALQGLGDGSESWAWLCPRQTMCPEPCDTEPCPYKHTYSCRQVQLAQSKTLLLRSSWSGPISVQRPR